MNNNYRYKLPQKNFSKCSHNMVYTEFMLMVSPGYCHIQLNEYYM